MRIESYSGVSFVSIYSIDLQFQTAVRLGCAGLDDQNTTLTIPADRMFSWIALGWLRLFGEADFQKSIVESYSSSKPALVISDGFPLVDGDLCVPIPGWISKLRPHNKQHELPFDQKKLRGKWIQLDRLQACMRGSEVIDISALHQPVVATHIQSVRIGQGKGEDSLPFSTGVVVPRNSEISSSATNILNFKTLVEVENDELAERLESVLQFVKEEGFGGNRSSGLGQIKNVDLKTTRPKHTDSSNTGIKSGYALLSSCIPTDEMIESVSRSEADSNSYSIGTRSGWLYDKNGRATDYRKPSVSIFETGSLFVTRPNGRLADISQHGHTCFRYGVPFILEG